MASNNKKAIPILLCGGVEAVGRPVAEGIKPEYETIRFILGPENAKSEVPKWASGPPTTLTGGNDTVGSGDFSQPPQAIIFGGAFSDELVDNIRQQCAEQLSIPWILKGKDHHGTDPNVPRPGGPGYAQYAARKCKELLGELGEKGLMGKDGLYRW